MMRSTMTTAALALLLLAASASARVLRHTTHDNIHGDDETTPNHCVAAKTCCAAVIGGWPVVLPVEMADLDDFVILAGAAVTSSGPSEITGDVGIYPGTAVTGVTPILPGCFNFTTGLWAVAVADTPCEDATDLPVGGWAEMRPDYSGRLSVIYTPTSPVSGGADASGLKMIAVKKSLGASYNAAAGTVVSQLCMDELQMAYNEADADGDTSGTVSGVKVTGGDKVTSPTPWLLSGEIGGLTITAGLYVSDAGFAVTIADLTLSGTGVFIFQMASTFEMGADRKITLINGADANSIFWQVGSAANVGANSLFKGTMMTMAAITMETGATVDGRLFSRNAAVTMLNIEIAKPSV
jgi:hypothetical protein